MIPKKIHYCWFGKKEKPDLVKKCIKSWKKILPDYEIKEWNESNIELNNEYIKTALKNKNYANTSNLIRLNALYKEGGIYFDTDIEVIKSFDSLLENSCFLGFQDKEKNSNTFWVNNAVLGSVKNNNFIKRLYENIINNFDGEEAANLSSPGITTKVLIELGLNEYKLQKINDIKIYPIEYFYPYPWNGKFTKDCIKEETYCIHHWMKSW